MKTYTDHPAYQEPLKRSKTHSKIRYILGIVVCVCIAIPLSLVALLAVPYSIYETYFYFQDPEFRKNVAVLYFLSPFICMTLVYAGYTLFCWGKHLTRPSSREFV